VPHGGECPDAKPRREMRRSIPPAWVRERERAESQMSAPVALRAKPVSFDRLAMRKDLKMNNPGNDSRAFEGLEGWREYQRFDESVTTGGRYFRDAVAGQFLASMRTSYDDRRMIVAAGERYWRAQPGCILSRRPLKESDMVTEQDLPYLPDRMKPIVSWNHEGRANPRGVAYLYVATTSDTALAEIRPWVGSFNTCSELEIGRELRLVNCALHHGDPLNLFGVNGATRSQGRWAAIDQAFATPVDSSAIEGRYIPTQTLAEMFKQDGFDGALYKSRLNGTGFNVVLFDLSCADVIDSRVYRTTAMDFHFERDDGNRIRIPI
jgi:hypothetical protein